MLTRRESILGGALTLLWGCGCGCAHAKSLNVDGCMIEPSQAQALLNAATEPQLFDRDTEKMVAGSGNRDFDRALARTLSRLTDTFGVLPGFSFFDDVEDENAFATRATKLKRADGTVLFGTRYFARAMREKEAPEVSVIATCAHEFGHIVQYKHGLDKRLKAGQPNVKRLELHADFFAGFFAGTRKLQKPDFPAAVFATNRFARGDMNAAKQSHHGTPNERAAAIVRGFETAYRERRSFADAIGIGLNYVERL